MIPSDNAPVARAERDGLRELTENDPIFVGFKMDGSLRRRLQSLEGPDRRYVSTDDPTFLTICRLGEDQYVGKIVDGRLTTDRVEDVRRNVVSILQRLCPDHRLPAQFEILPCRPAGGPVIAAAADAEESL